MGAHSNGWNQERAYKVKDFGARKIGIIRPTEWDAFLAETAAKTGADEWQLVWLIQESAEMDNCQWDRLDEIKRLGT